jgi:electron transfer flavoprotein alpha subunit
LLDVMQVSDILSVESEDTFTADLRRQCDRDRRSSDAKKVITVRTTAFEKAAAEGGSGTIEQVPGTGDAGLSSFVGLEAEHCERPELTGAKIIVSGGRALGSGEQFHA